MTPYRMNDLRQIFEDVRTCAPESRGAVLDEACGTDAGLRAEVEALLERDEQGSTVLDAPMLSDAERRRLIDEADDATAGHPERVGAYRIVRWLGSGSMGAVYEAEQDMPRRSVALKLVRAPLFTASVVARFEHEVAVLARLQHPGIARIHDAGITGDEGATQAYLAMELVHGQRLGDCATEQDLDLPAALTLLAQVCDAVHYAHTRGVIHRDLKPGNVMVTEEGRPKILDFGVARITDGDATSTALRTLFGQLIGTLQYMSPEQVAGDPAVVDTRSDVYALGVIGYELLHGSAPYDVSCVSLAEAERIIESAPIPRLTHRGSPIARDVEWVIGKALARDPGDRYQSAFDFADDLRRLIAREPVRARPPGLAYQLRTFARRRKGLVAALATVCLLFVLGTLGTGIGFVRAQQRQQDTEELAGFLTSMLASADVDAMGKDVTVRDLLDIAPGTLEAQFAGRPHLEARLRHTIGATYLSLGDYSAAELHLERARALATLAFGDVTDESLAIMDSLGDLYFAQSRYREAEDLFRGVLGHRLERDGPEHPRTLETKSGLALAHRAQARYDVAESMLQEVLEVRRAVLGVDHLDTLETEAELAWVYRVQSRFEAAEPINARVLATRRRLLGDEHRLTLKAEHEQAWLIYRQGRYAEAEAGFRRAAVGREAILGPDHADTLDSLYNISVMSIELGKLDEAIELLQRILPARRRTVGPEHISTLTTIIALSAVYRRTDRCEEAIALLEESLPVMRREFGGENRHTIDMVNQLAIVYQCVERYEESESLYLENLAQARVVYGASHTRVFTALNNLARLYLDWGRLEEAEANYAEAVSIGREVCPPGHPSVGVLLRGYGRTLVARGRYAEAEPTLLEALDIIETALGPDHSRTDIVLESLVQLYEAWGRPEDARRYRELRAVPDDG